MHFREIEDLREIAGLDKALKRKLRVAAVRSETRTIGYPSGHTNRKVFFLEDKRESFWYTSFNNDRGTVVNLFGQGTFGSNDTLTIDVQFNYSRDDFTRRLGGVFLKNSSTGEILLAHRGIVTLRHRVKKDVLFEAMASRVVEAKTSSGTDEFLLITDFSSSHLVNEIRDFSYSLRSTLQALGAQGEVSESLGGEAEESDDIDTESEALDETGFEGLRAYFSEFSGQRREYAPKKVYPVSHHGTVVDRLNLHLCVQGEVLKSRAIDLVVNEADRALLFEVKTDASTQNVYTAIGQLFTHMPVVQKYTGKPVINVMVLPELPMEKMRVLLRNELGIRVVTYTLSAEKAVTFDGLETI